MVCYGMEMESSILFRELKTRRRRRFFLLLHYSLLCSVSLPFSNAMEYARLLPVVLCAVVRDLSWIEMDKVCDGKKDGRVQPCLSPSLFIAFSPSSFAFCLSFLLLVLAWYRMVLCIMARLFWVLSIGHREGIGHFYFYYAVWPSAVHIAVRVLNQDQECASPLTQSLCLIQNPTMTMTMIMLYVYAITITPIPLVRPLSKRLLRLIGKARLKNRFPNLFTSHDKIRRIH